MGKLPAFQFYPADWRKDPGVQALTYEHRGIWFEILCLMHESDDRGKLLLNGAAMPEDALARMLGLDKQNLTTGLTTLLTYGVASRDPETGALMCRRMVRDENLRKIRQNAGKMGGNPVLLNQKPTTQVKQIPTPSSSSSVTSSSPNTNHCQVTETEQAIQVYDLYPRKQGRTEALKAIRSALKAVPLQTLRERTQAYSAATAKWPEPDKRFIPHPATWFNRGSYDDDPATWNRQPQTLERSNGRGFEQCGDYSGVTNKL